MAYDMTKWIDHIVDEDDNIVQQGTPISAHNLNHLEEAVFTNTAINKVLEQELKQHKRLLSDLEGEVGEINLTNSLQYPFNDSAATVALEKARDTLNYRVDVEVVSSVGTVGDISVYDKQLNGFKIKFSSSATSATIKYIVQGGMYQW